MCKRAPLLLIPAFVLLMLAGRAPAQSFREEAIQAAQRGDLEAAVSLYEQALNSALKVLKEEDVEITMRRLELGEAYRAAGQWEKAIAQLEYVWKRARYDAEQKKKWQGDEGTAAFGAAEKLGRAYQGAGRYAEAAVVFATAISDGERSQRDADEILEFDGLLVDTLLLLKRAEEAVKITQRAVQRIAQRHSDNSDKQVRMLSTLGMLFYHHGFYKEGAPVVRLAVDLAAQDLPGSVMMGFALSNLGGMLMHLDGRMDEAVNHLKAAEQVYMLTLNRDAKELLQVHLNLSEAEALMGRNELAEQRGLEALRLARLHFPEDSLQMARCLTNLAGCYVGLKQPGKAADLYARALEIQEQNLGRDHPETVQSREMLELARTAVSGKK